MYLQADKKAIKKELLDIIENSRRKVTPGELEKTLSRKYSLEKKRDKITYKGTGSRKLPDIYKSLWPDIYREIFQQTCSHIKACHSETAGILL